MCPKGASAPSVPQFPQLSPPGSEPGLLTDLSSGLVGRSLPHCPARPPPQEVSISTPNGQVLVFPFLAASSLLLGVGAVAGAPPELGLSCPLPGPAHSSPGFPCLRLPSVEGHSVGSCPGRPCGLTWLGEVWV